MFPSHTTQGGFQCPTCKKSYGARTGDMPDGTMTVHACGSSLPGHVGHDTVQITYNFTSGSFVSHRTLAIGEMYDTPPSLFRMAGVTEPMASQEFATYPTLQRVKRYTCVCMCTGRVHMHVYTLGSSPMISLLALCDKNLYEENLSITVFLASISISCLTLS